MQISQSERKLIRRVIKAKEIIQKLIKNHSDDCPVATKSNKAKCMCGATKHNRPYYKVLDTLKIE
jgi:hypothetical protein